MDGNLLDRPHVYDIIYITYYFKMISNCSEKLQRKAILPFTQIHLSYILPHLLSHSLSLYIYACIAMCFGIHFKINSVLDGSTTQKYSPHPLLCASLQRIILPALPAIGLVT